MSFSEWVEYKVRRFVAWKEQNAIKAEIKRQKDMDRLKNQLKVEQSKADLRALKAKVTVVRNKHRPKPKPMSIGIGSNSPEPKSEFSGMFKQDNSKRRY